MLPAQTVQFMRILLANIQGSNSAANAPFPLPAGSAGAVEVPVHCGCLPGSQRAIDAADDGRVHAESDGAV